MARAGSRVSYPWTDMAPGVSDVIGEVSKEALAAVALSLLTCGGDRPDGAASALLRELDALADAGIIPRGPSRGLRDRVARAGDGA